MRAWIFILSFILAISGSLGCSKIVTPETQPAEVTGEKTIHLTEEKQKTLSLETIPVQRKKLNRPIFATGKAIQDPQQMEFLFTSQGGVLRKILRPVGSWVAKGDPIVQIDGSTIRASKTGTVISINALPGQKIDRMLPIATIANTNPIRVIFDVFPQDMDRIRIGQNVEVNLIGHEEENFPGRVVYLSPNLDDVSQSMKVGVDVENRGGHIKYGMFVHGQILQEISENALVIPEAALARFDQDYAVFVRKGPEEFEKRPIKVGLLTGKEVEILSGLSAGEQVVTKGTFQLKSEFLSHLLESEE